MGVDYYGYSCVRSEPIPAAYRPIISEWSAEEKAEFKAKYGAAPADVRPLLLAINGVSRDSRGGFVFPQRIETADTDEKAPFRADPNFLEVLWDRNIVYYKTAETVEGTAGRSYSGYGDFRKLVDSLAEDKFYMPPSTDTAPENGFLTTTDCINCLRGLNTVRKHFVSDVWVPDPAKYGNDCAHRFADAGADDVNTEHSWFFREFYSVIHLGANGGFVRIS